MSFTFIFGLYSAVILTKTHSIFACILLHSYCNSLGFPKISEVVREPNPAIKNKLLGAYLIGIVLFFVMMSLY